MDEQKKIHDTDAQSIQPEELAEPDLVAEEAFRAEREKRIEGFVLNISEDELADDPVLPEQKPEPEPAPVAPKRVERPLVRRKKNSLMYITIYL